MEAAGTAASMVETIARYFLAFTTCISVNSS